MWISRSAWFPTPIEDVVAAGLQVASLPAWHGTVAAIDAPDAVDLRDPLAGGRLTFVDWRGQAPASWRVRRRIRSTVHLDVVTDRGEQVELLVSCSPWDGGTLVELGMAPDDARGWLDARDAGRRLEASLAALHRRATGARGPSRPAPVARPRPVTTSG